MKRLYKFLFPKYARLPLVLVLLCNTAVFWLIPLLQGDVYRYDLTTAWDEALPFVPAFILVYVLSYIQWVGSYLYHAHDSRALCYRMTNADLLAKGITMLFFLFLPTQMVRPEVVGNGPFEWLTRLIYLADKPISLFPSIHCLESWLCFRTAMMMQKKHTPYILTQFVFTLLVCASTVLVKQHFVLDVFGGIAVAEIGLLLYDKVPFTHFIQKIQLPSARE